MRKMPLFSRLVAGYLAILFVVMAVSVYAIVQLHQLNRITRSLLEVDRRILDYEDKLRDTLLSQIRYERKFLIAQDKALYDQFLLFQTNFQRDLEEISALADSSLELLLKTIREQHQAYASRLN